MMALVDHLERFLGPIQDGWASDADGTPMPFQVVRFDEGAGPDTISYGTLGLSRYPLPSPKSGRSIRQELLMLAPKGLARGPLPALMLQVALAAMDERRALLRGDVLGPHGPLVEGSRLEALYVAMPAYFPDEFATCEGEDGPVVVAWLVPISVTEAEYVRREGWSSFEDRLVEFDPDLTDFNRQPMHFRV